MNPQSRFLRGEGELFKIVVIRNIDEVIGYRRGNVSNNQNFAELQHGDIVYNQDHENYRDYAFNVIRVYSDGQKCVEPIVCHNGLGVEIKTDITSQIENPISFYENLANYQQQNISDLFIMLDNAVHHNIIYNYSSMDTINKYKFVWWQHSGNRPNELAIINGGASIGLEGRRVDNEYGHTLVDYTPPNL